MSDTCTVCERTEAEHGGLIHEFMIGEFRVLRVRRCAECGSSSKHKASCPRAVLCAECGSSSKHKASCPRNITSLKHPYCGDCGNLIRSDAHRTQCEGRNVVPMRKAME